MFHLKNDKWIIIYLNVLRLLGVLPYIWKYTKPTNGFQINTNGIKSVKLSYIILFFSILYHIAMIFIFVMQIDDNFLIYREMFDNEQSSTMETAMRAYKVVIIVYYCILVMIMVRKSKKLLKILIRYKIFFIYQWEPRGISISLMISVISYCSFFALFVLNFLELDYGIIKALTLTILPSSSIFHPILFIFLFSFCSETVGNGWKNNVLNYKITYFNDSNSKKNAIPIDEQIDNNLHIHLEIAAINALYLNSLQYKINKAFTEAISLILTVTISICICTVFSLVSEKNNTISTFSSICNIIMCMTIFIRCCNASRTSQVQVIYQIIRVRKRKFD